MRKFTLAEYVDLSIHFNQMSFFGKIELIRNNSDILTLASDGNWWGVKVKDEGIQEEVFDKEIQFNIKQEWGLEEMCALVNLLGIDIIQIYKLLK